MKNIISYFKVCFFVCSVVLMLLTACGHSNKEKAQMEQGNTITYEIPKIKLSVDKSGESDLCDCYSGMDYQIYSFQGCEYIKFGYGHSSWGAHSGVCPNPIHRYKPETISEN